MKALKSGLTEMKSTNLNGTFDDAIDLYRKAFKVFLTNKEYRSELPEEEEPAAIAA